VGDVVLPGVLFEIDAESGTVVRHWAAGRETPAHINSDVTISDTELIWCNGGSQTVVLLDLDSFADYRILGIASWAERLRRPDADRQPARSTVAPRCRGRHRRTVVSDACAPATH
jgi:hypothetical protein